MVEEILRAFFGIRSKTYRVKRKGATWNNGGKTVVLRKDSYNLCIFRRQDVKTFVSKIGFVIQRKQETAERALYLIESLGTSRAAEIWEGSTRVIVE